MDQEFGKIILLAIIQGVTEFLPISSSGHLVVFQRMLGMTNGEENLFVAVILHAGTLLAILTFYARDIVRIIRQREWRIFGLVAAGTLPLVILGIPLMKMLENNFDNIWLVVVCFLFTAFMLLVVHHKNNENLRLKEMPWVTAVIIGIMQCVSVLPGVSRSGTTIATATRLGIDKASAARFSFFLGIPAIGGATLLDVLDILRGPSPVLSSVSGLVVGFFVAFIVGFISLAILIKALSSGKFSWFGYYVLVVAVAVTVMQLAG